MAEQDQTAGTPAQDGGDAAEKPTTGTPAAEDRNAEPQDERWKEALQWKAKAERVNQLEAELASIRAASQPPPAAADEVEYWAGVEEDAKSGDRTAKGLLAQRRETALAIQFLMVPEADRDQVRELWLKSGARGDIAQVHEAIKQQRKEQTLKERDEEIAKLRDELKRAALNKPDPNTPVTHLREATATGAILKQSRADWKREQAELGRRADQGDEAARRERIKKQLDVRSKKLVLED